MNYSAVIAAAGLSSRMQEFKPLLPLGDTTMIGSVIRALRSAGTEEIVVVTGHNAPALEAYLRGFDVGICRNTDYASTDMFASLRLGIRALTAPYDRIFLTPGDVPLVQPETLSALQSRPGSAVCPICGGIAGHPVLLSAALAPALLAYSGENGLRGFLQTLEQALETLEVKDTGVTLDADTPEDYARLQSALADKD